MAQNCQKKIGPIEIEKMPKNEFLITFKACISVV